jgi:hypothetical protein
VSLDPALRRRVEEMVRPLYAGLDGRQTFDRVARLERWVGELAAGGPDGASGSEVSGAPEVDGELLELLVLLHGVVARLGSLGRDGRLALFLRASGVSEERSRRLRQALGRETPESAEEELLHDALLLESAGVGAAVERLMEAGRKRLDPARALSRLDPGPPPERYRTAAGAALGAARRAAAQSWLEDLRHRLATDPVS